ncbi:hypothetical protein FRX31_023222 [Thalictrum thalictroides]|uniref:Uncharacterized protein n=1 Tax=Thalictrum thalictroides TaxID=46969 RepID=A0A7J6VQZ5_THATH|nr:hypothetical protein FRX31_023222 [Thalictrum thalictroides]
MLGEDGSSAGSNNFVMDSYRVVENKKREFFPVPMSKEEMRLRNELAMEIEKELEREIMEGILMLVHRLSDLKAKQQSSVYGLKNFHMDSIQQLDVLLRNVMGSKFHKRDNVNKFIKEQQQRRRRHENVARRGSGIHYREPSSVISDAKSSSLY